MASTPKRIEYSDGDIVLLSLLSAKPISSINLAEKYYKLRPPKPVNSRQSIISMMTSLIDNVDFNDENYKIIKAPRSGPNPMEYRKVRR